MTGADFERRTRTFSQTVEEYKTRLAEIPEDDRCERFSIRHMAELLDELEEHMWRHANMALIAMNAGDDDNVGRLRMHLIDVLSKCNYTYRLTIPQLPESAKCETVTR